MERIDTQERPHWERTVERQGLVYHHWNDNGTMRRYWDESAYYRFTAAQAAEIESVTDELNSMCLQAAQHIIDHRLFDRLGIHPDVVPYLVENWDADPASIYGRFDLVYDGVHPPKMLEYNADTPTCLLEAAVVQWQWAYDKFPDADQYNAIHDYLVAAWDYVRPALLGDTLHVAHSAGDKYGEDYFTCMYLQDTAQQAGIKTRGLRIEDLDFDGDAKCFRGLQGERISSIFKLYPWEWLLSEDGGQHLLDTMESTVWIEPMWKMLLSNKGLLPILWELFPGHPNLLPAYFDGPRDLVHYAKKPMLGREGANVTLVHPGGTTQTEGNYGEEGYVYQQFEALPSFKDGWHTVIGSWVVGQKACGMGIRESRGLVTDERQVFLPHLVVG